MNDADLIQAMIAGTKLVVRDRQHAAAQLEHLKKYRDRTAKRLARDTDLPVEVVKRFKELVQTQQMFDDMTSTQETT